MSDFCFLKKSFLKKNDNFSYVCISQGVKNKGKNARLCNIYTDQSSKWEENLTIAVRHCWIATFSAKVRYNPYTAAVRGDKMPANRTFCTLLGRRIISFRSETPSSSHLLVVTSRLTAFFLQSCKDVRITRFKHFVHFICTTTLQIAYSFNWA